MLSEAEFALVAREVKQRSGVVLTRSLSAAIEMRLQPLARREALASVNELLSAARLRADGRLWSAIVDSLAQCETRFFRDRTAFRRMREEILPDTLARRGHERVRIWSSACATGQEAFSLAMIVEELREEGLSPAVEIIASDISERLIEKARAGLYTQFEVQRGLPIRKLIAHFERAGDLWRIDGRLRAAVRFEPHNLLRRADFGQFDIVLLCHVLSSFDDETAAEVIGHVLDCLHPGGCIILGAGETPPAGLDGVIVEDGLVRIEGVRRAA